MQEPWSQRACTATSSLASTSSRARVSLEGGVVIVLGLWRPLSLLRWCTIAPLVRCSTAPPAPLLLYCSTDPLHRCTAPLHHCTAALHHRSTAPPLRHCTAAPLHHCTTAQLHHCATAPLHHRYTTAPLHHRSSATPPLHRSTVPLHHCTTAPPLHRSTAPPLHFSLAALPLFCPTATLRRPAPWLYSFAAPLLHPGPLVAIPLLKLCLTVAVPHRCLLSSARQPNSTSLPS